MIKDETGRRKKQHVSCAEEFIQKDTPNKPKRVGQLRYTGRKNNLKESGAYRLPLGQNLVQASTFGWRRRAGIFAGAAEADWSDVRPGWEAKNSSAEVVSIFKCGSTFMDVANGRVSKD